MAKREGLSERVRRAREIAGLGQRELCRLAGTAHDLVHSIEAGGAIDPRISSVARLSEALGVSIDWLAGLDLDDPNPAIIRRAVDKARARLKAA